MGAGSTDGVNVSALLKEDSRKAGDINTCQFTFGQILLVHDGDVIIRAAFPCNVVHTYALGKTEFATQISREEGGRIGNRGKRNSCTAFASQSRYPGPEI